MNTTNLVNLPLSQHKIIPYDHHQTLGNTLKTFSILGVASVVTIGLFWLMSLVIAQSGEPPIETGPAVIIDPVFNERELITNVIEPLPPKPERIEPPKTPSKALEPNESDNTSIFNGTFEIASPQIETSPKTSLSVSGGDARPIVRISPQYPIKAAREGIDGWVQLSFSINELGGVEDIVVVDAQPKRIFNRAAMRALRKWKYRPKTVDGEPVKQVNMSVQLDFTLEGNSAQ